MAFDILIVPGYHGSGETHWQTWLEQELPSARRVSGIDWAHPILHNWAKAIMRDLDSISRPTIVVAHSFGCLASALAVANRPQQVAGVILVAPADPHRFTLSGPRSGRLAHNPGIAAHLPDRPLDIPGLLIGSRNDPWMKFSHAYAWSKRWKLAFYDAGQAGHINVDSGYGPWPFIKMVTQSLGELVQEKPALPMNRDQRNQVQGLSQAPVIFRQQHLLYA